MSASKQQAKVVSVGIHKVESVISVGRFDLAAKYSQELTKAVPPPKSFKPAQPVEIAGKAAVVLPVEFKAALVILEGSQEFKLSISANQRASEAKELNYFRNSVGEAVRKTHEEAAKGEKRSSRGIFGALTGISVVGMIGLVVLCALFPALLPVVGNLFRLLVSGVNSALSWVTSVLRKFKSGN